MKIFERDGKINFVDENNVFLGYDINMMCCEYADWFIADKPQEQTQKRNTEIPDLNDFVFDTSFFKKIDNALGDDSCTIVIFRIVSKGGYGYSATEKFIHLFNVQNGYYGHGFDFIVGKDTIHRGCI